MGLPSDVCAFVKRNYRPEDQEEALSMLGQALIHDGTAPSPRLLRCAAFAGRGDSTLQSLVSILAIDWRDVIVAGEYELRDKTLVHVRDLNKPLLADQGALA